MTPRNYESMQRANRKRVGKCHRKRILSKDFAILGEIAEDAAFVSFGVGLTNRPEVRVVAIAFGGIAAVAKRLEILNRINSAMFSRLDVIDLQSSLVGRNSTQFTMELCPLQNLIPQGSRNIS